MRFGLNSAFVFGSRYCLFDEGFDGVYAISWLAGYCLNEQLQHKQLCDPAKISLWDQQSFTIHGMWPQITTESTYGEFDIHLFEKQFKLIDDMSNYWPPKTKQSTTKVFLWDHQWTTHGKDYSAILLKLKPEVFPTDITLRNGALQLAYFNDALEFYKRFNIKKTPTGNYTKSEFAALLGLPQNQFIFMCAKSNIVREVQICFQTTKSGNILKNCTKTSATCTKGGQTIQLVNWAEKYQARVFNYPDQINLTSQ